jgi:hypothetical protein
MTTANGLTDEGNPESGAACSTGLPGACSGGTTACSGGALTCTADSAGTPEVCDGLDNDCNGAVDDGVSFTGALASWPADGSANDALGTHDGTLLGGMGYGAGLAGSAFQFDGVDDAATFGTTLGDFGTADFSLEFWMSTTSTRLEGLINKRSVCGNGSFFDIRLSGGRLKVELNQSGSNVNSFNSAQTINDGSWHHVVLTRQAKTVQLYIDGSLDTAKSTAGTTNISNGVAFSMAQHVCIGVDPTQRLTGLLDEVHVFGRALSATEVAPAQGSRGRGLCLALSSSRGARCRFQRKTRRNSEAVARLPRCAGRACGERRAAPNLLPCVACFGPVKPDSATWSPSSPRPRVSSMRSASTTAAAASAPSPRRARPPGCRRTRCWAGSRRAMRGAPTRPPRTSAPSR